MLIIVTFSLSSDKKTVEVAILYPKKSLRRTPKSLGVLGHQYVVSDIIQYFGSLERMTRVINGEVSNFYVCSKEKKQVAMTSFLQNKPSY